MIIIRWDVICYFFKNNCILICIGNNIHEKHVQQQILTARAFLVDSNDWLKQTTTFVKFKLFQDERFQNHSAKNLEMC